MPRRLILVIALLANAGMAAQERPDFSGTWILVQERSTRTIQGNIVTSITGLLGERFTATQGPQALSLAISANGREIAVTYALDGSESRNMNPTAPGQPDEPIFSTAAWEEGRLVIRTRGSALVNGRPLESTRVMWIDADGALTIERRSDGVPATRSVYRRERAAAAH